MGLVAPWHVGSSRTRALSCVSCIGRRTLDHCTTREVPIFIFLNDNLSRPLVEEIRYFKIIIIFRRLYYKYMWLLFFLYNVYRWFLRCAFLFYVKSTDLCHPRSSNLTSTLNHRSVGMEVTWEVWAHAALVLVLT